MNDPNAPLRGLLDGWATDRATISAHETEGIEAPPRSHGCPTATADDGVKGEERRQERPLTPAAGGATDPATTPQPLEPGSVVRWTTPRGEGLGQVLVDNGYSVNIRTWLPARSKEITVHRHCVTFICTLPTLLGRLEQSQ